MKKQLALLLTFLMGLAMLSIGFQQSATATPGGGDDGCTTEYSGWVTQSPGEGWVKIDTRTVVDKAAYDDPPTKVVDVAAKHYSLKGNSGLGTYDTPAPPGPGVSYWQDNTSQEPHGSDGVTWLSGVGSGLHYTSAGSSGKREWFYFQPEVSHMVPGAHHDAVTHEEYKYKKVTCPPDEPPFTPYEVDACWTMSHSDGVENTYEWPQTYGCEPPECEETVEYQYDTYWIRDETDEATLANIKANGMTGPESDASLEPHDYYSKIVTGGDCPNQTVQPVTPPVLDACGPGNAVWNLAGGSPSNFFTYDLDNNGVLTLIAVAGWEFPNGQHTYVLGVAPDSNEPCPEEPHVVSPNAVGVPDDCDADPFGTITVTPIEGVTYYTGGNVITGTIPANGVNVVTAVLAEGYVLAEGAKDTWTFESNPATGCVPTKPEPIRSSYDTSYLNCSGVYGQTVTTFIDWIWDEEEGEWVQAAPVVTTSASFFIRALTHQEQIDNHCLTVVPVAQFGAPTPPTCETAGSYSLPDLTPNVDFTISPAYAGPGTYTVTATLVGTGVEWADGTTAPKTATITVEGALGFQSTNPDAPCYLAPTPDCENSPSPTTCPEPEGTRDEETTKECVNGDLVTTHSVSGTNAVWNEETLEWDLVPFVSSSQSIKKDAHQCSRPPHHPHHNPPNVPGVPVVPTGVDAGLSSVSPNGGGFGLPVLAALMGAVLMVGSGATAGASLIRRGR